MKANLWLAIVGAGCVGLSACAREASGPTEPDVQRPAQAIAAATRPHGHVFFAFPAGGQVLEAAGALQPTIIGDPTITYHGGPIIQSQKVATIYWSSRTIYRGGPAAGSAGAGSSDGSLVGFFLNHLGGSPYYAINSLYHDGSGHFIQNSVTYSQFWASNTGVPAAGSNVTLATLEAKIQAGFTGGSLTFDSNTVYLVFTDSAVDQDNLYAVGACAEHGHFSWNGHDVKFGAMPRDLDKVGCRQGDHPDGGVGSPNNDPAADVEVNTIAHETEETNTDEDINAWFDAHSNESADKCAWLFAPKYTTANGATANMNIGGKDFLVQKEWQLAFVQGCEVQVFAATISGPFQAQPFALCNWTANPSGGASPYTYAWLGQSKFSSRTVGYANTGSSFNMFVNITDSNGVTEQPTEFVDVSQFDPRCGS